MTYERPAIIASYSAEELTTEAAVSMTYGGQHDWWKWW